MPTMEQIEVKAKAHAQAREKLSEIVTALRDGIEALKRSHMTKLKAAVNKAVETSEELRALVEKSPTLFVKPKSVIFYGIKAGYRKEKGKIEFDDADKVIKLIRKHFPEQADVLIITEEKPSKEAINKLTAEQVKKIGVTITSDTDVAFVSSTDSEIDKMVGALLKGAEEVAA